jgi:hypothetical protein
MAKKNKKKNKKFNWRKAPKITQTTGGQTGAVRSLRAGLVHLFLPQFKRMQECIVSGVRDNGGSTGGPRTTVHPILGLGCTNPVGYDISLSFAWGPRTTTNEYTMALILADPLAAGSNRTLDCDTTTRVFQFISEPRFIAFDTSANDSQAFPSTALTTRQLSDGYITTCRIGSDRVPMIAISSAAGSGGTGGANDRYTSYSASALPTTVQTLNAHSGGFGLFNSAPGSLKYHGQMFMAAIWNRKLSDEEDRAFHDDPFSLIEDAGSTSNRFAARNSVGGSRSFGSVIS